MRTIKVTYRAVVPTKIIVSTRANVEPTCPQCLEIYRKEFQHA